MSRCQSERSADGGPGLPSDGPGSTTAEGASPSNTAPPKYNNPPDNAFRPLKWGVDSLYLSYPGNLDEESDKTFLELKTRAQSSDPRLRATAQYTFDDHIFEFSDRGRSVFSYVLRDNHFDLALSKSSSRQVPLASVQFRSHLIRNQGIQESEGFVWRFLRTLSEDVDEPVISRVDVFLDFTTDAHVAHLSNSGWVSKADVTNRFLDAHCQTTGWTFGRGAMMARLYNKTAEIEKTGNKDVEATWRRAGWNGTDTVWRLEFQFRRGSLSTFPPIAVAEIPDACADLWRYGTVDWLRLTIPNPDDANRSRWKTHRLWESIQAIDWGSSGPPTRREVPTSRPPSDEWFAIQGLGPLTSYMAKHGIHDLAAANDAFLSSQRRFHDLAREESIEEYVAKKVAEKGRLYNTIKNPDPEPNDGQA